MPGCSSGRGGPPNSQLRSSGFSATRRSVQRLGANGRAAVLDGMTVERMADAMLLVYEAALGGGGAASANGTG